MICPTGVSSIPFVESTYSTGSIVTVLPISVTMNADSQSIVFNPGPSGFVLTQLTLILNDATGHQQFLTETSQSTVGTYISSIVFTKPSCFGL